MTDPLSPDDRQVRQNALFAEHGQLVRRLFERKAQGLPHNEEEAERLEAVRQELDELDAPLIQSMKQHWKNTFGIDLGEDSTSKD